MFFIGIFGIENKDKEIKIIDNITCKRCNKIIRGKLMKNYDFFHFFSFHYLNGMKTII